MNGEYNIMKWWSSEQTYTACLFMYLYQRSPKVYKIDECLTFHIAHKPKYVMSKVAVFYDVLSNILVPCAMLKSSP